MWTTRATKTNAMRALERSGLAQQVRHYDCDIRMAVGAPSREGFKTLVPARASGQNVLLMVSGHQEVDIKRAPKSS